MLTRDSGELKKPDIVVLASVVVLIGAGLFAVYSATQQSNPSVINNFSKQLIWVLVGAVVLAVVAMVPLRLFYKNAWVLYGASLVLLVLVLLIGGGTGATRWFTIGPFRFQPSELAKIAALFALARFIAADRRNLNSVQDMSIAFLIVLLPMALVIKQPDLGTSLVFLAVVLPMLFWAGMSLFTVFLLVAPVLTLVAAFNLTAFFIVMALITGAMVVSGRGLKIIIPNFLLNVGVGIVTPLLWGTMHAYQQRRILTFLGLQQDPKGIGYQVLQSQVAIGSGSFSGKGWLQGTQTQLRFLPEQHTDFIFSVIGEEFGFIGVAVVLLAFFVLLRRAFKIASECRNRFASLVVVGAAVILMFHVVVNVGMTVGIMPVTGLPLPFLSYGGSALLANMILIGLIVNAGRRRFQYI